MGERSYLARASPFYSAQFAARDDEKVTACYRATASSRYPVGLWKGVTFYPGTLLKTAIRLCGNARHGARLF